MADEEQDKSELPTPHKLQEARKKGQVAKSMELNSWMILLCAFALFVLVGAKIVESLVFISTFLFSQSASMPINVDSVVHLMGDIRSAVQQKMWPFFLSLGLMAAFATLVQIGFMFTVFPLKPDLNRLNPVQGFKRLFSKKLLFESFKNILKLIILCAVFYGVLFSVLPSFPLLLDMPAGSVLLRLKDHLIFLVACLLAALLSVAILDFIYSRKEFMGKMRMSKRELKDEVKRREGDPLVRQKRRQAQQELSAQLSSMGSVSDADVVITNPTHLAVALKYERATMAAPCVIAKGSGASALKMREIARRSNIHIVENKPLARKLFRASGINQPIPAEVFPLVAQVYIWLHRQKLASQD